MNDPIFKGLFDDMFKAIRIANEINAATEAEMQRRREVNRELRGRELADIEAGKRFPPEE